MIDKKPTMQQTALELLSYGLTIHPLRPRDKAPAVQGWQQLRMTEVDVRAYWGQHPDANVGLICGATGWVALDLDGDAWLAWALDHFPPTPLRTVSGSGHGGHLIYRWPVGVPVPKRKLEVPHLPDSRKDRSVVHQGGDLYGDGSQIVLPGSVHPSGGLYRWAFDGPLPPVESIPVFDLAWLPSQQAQQPELMQPAQSEGEARLKRGRSEDRRLVRAEAWIAKRDGAVQGARGDDHTFVTACTLVHDFELHDAEAWALLWQWNARCAPPWGEAELRQKLQSAKRSGKGGPKAERPMEGGGGYTAELQEGAAQWRAEAEQTGIGLQDRPFFDDGDDPPAAPTARGSAPTRKREAPAQTNKLDAQTNKLDAQTNKLDAQTNKPGRLTFPVRERGKPVKDHARNTAALLQHFGAEVRYNLMTHQLEVQIPTFKVHQERSANVALDWVENRAAEHGLARAPILKHLNELAREYHPVLQWVQSKPWDGVDRLPELLASVELQACVQDRELCGLLIYRWLVGAAAAILPDFDGRFAAQGVLVFQGEQGRAKTRWLRSLAPPGSAWVLTGRMLDPRDRDSVQAATSVWLCELGEVDATFKRSDIAALKAFVTQESDTYRSAYARREERVIRRTAFFASVNPEHYLVDKTGNRRWWTVPIERCHPEHGIDVQQLWAQMAVEARQPSARWWLDDDELARLSAVNSDHEPDDALAAEVRDHWQACAPFDVTRPPRGVSLAEICRALPSFATKTPSPTETHRIVQALRDVGVQGHKGKLGRVYYAERTAQSQQQDPAPSSSRGWDRY